MPFLARISLTHSTRYPDKNLHAPSGQAEVTWRNEVPSLQIDAPGPLSEKPAIAVWC
jgi:hypothetical protein